MPGVRGRQASGRTAVGCLPLFTWGNPYLPKTEVTPVLGTASVQACNPGPPPGHSCKSFDVEETP